MYMMSTGSIDAPSTVPPAAGPDASGSNDSISRPSTSSFSLFMGRAPGKREDGGPRGPADDGDPCPSGTRGIQPNRFTPESAPPGTDGAGVDVVSAPAPVGLRRPRRTPRAVLRVSR